MRICIVCPVRKGTPQAVFDHVKKLEVAGHIVFFPVWDIGGPMPETDICQRMLMELDLANEVHVWYEPNSQGVHFDMGMLFVLQSERPRQVKWLNPVENPIGYETVLKEMCK